MKNVAKRVVVLLSVAGSLGLGAPRVPPSALVLSEVRSWELPAQFRVTGGAFTDDGRAMVWSSGSSYTLLQEGDRIVPIGKGTVRGPLAATVRHDTALVVDSALHAIVAIPVRGGAPTIVPAIWAGVVVEATPVDDGWLLLAVARTGDLVVETLNGFGHVTRTEALSKAFGNVALGQRVTANWRIATGPTGAVIDHINPPITVGAPGSSLPTLLAIVRTDAGLTFNLRLPNWLASPVLTLDDNERLISVADLSSDVRLLIRLDSLGQPTHTTAIDTPFGLLASSTTRKEIMAIRETDRSEVVIYKYAWKL